jgi:hypothetical protein
VSDAEEQEGYPAEDDGVLEPADSLETDILHYDPLDTGIIAPDRSRTMGLVGLTAAEARRGETLEEQMAQEEPDTDPAALDDRWEDGPGPRAGRLTQDLQDVRDGAELTAIDCGIDGGAAAAEEAAVHVTTQDQDEAAQLADGEENESIEGTAHAAAADESREARRRPRDE